MIYQDKYSLADSVIKILNKILCKKNRLNSKVPKSQTKEVTQKPLQNHTSSVQESQNSMPKKLLRGPKKVRRYRTKKNLRNRPLQNQSELCHQKSKKSSESSEGNSQLPNRQIPNLPNKWANKTSQRLVNPPMTKTIRSERDL